MEKGFPSEDFSYDGGTLLLFYRKLKRLRIFLLKTGLHNLPESLEKPAAVCVRVIEPKRKGLLIGEGDTAQRLRRHIGKRGKQCVTKLRLD